MSRIAPNGRSSAAEKPVSGKPTALPPAGQQTKFEAPLDIKFVGSMEGRFVLADRAVAAGESATQPCRSQSITASEVIIASPVLVRLGESVVCAFARLGKINGKVTRIVDGGFALAISASAAERKSLAATINWLKKRHTHLAEDQRAASRVRTRPEPCVVRIGDTAFTAELFDISSTGASLSTNTPPPLKTMVRIGHVEGEVVRHMEGRFGVKFSSAQDLSALIGALTAKPEPPAP